jgi:hypothetical protein
MCVADRWRVRGRLKPRSSFRHLVPRCLVVHDFSRRRWPNRRVAGTPGANGRYAADFRGGAAASTSTKGATMRVLLNVKIPHQQFNAAVKDGTAGSK